MDLLDYRELPERRAVRQDRLGRHVRARRPRPPAGLLREDPPPAQARRPADEPRHHRRRHAQPPARRRASATSSSATSSRAASCCTCRTCCETMAEAGLEPVDVENLRPHYATHAVGLERRARGAARPGAQGHARNASCAPTGSTSPAARCASSAAGSRCYQMLGARPTGDIGDGPMRGAQSAFPFNRGYMYPQS